MPTSLRTAVTLSMGFLLVAFLILAPRGTASQAMQKAAESSPSTSEIDAKVEIARTFYDLWKHLVKEQGKESLISERNGVVAACIPWERAQRLPGGLFVQIDHWWQDSDNSLAKNRSAVQERCEKWRTAGSHTCSCHVIAEGLSPVLDVRSDRLAQLDGTVTSISALPVQPLADTVLSTERSMPVIHEVEQLRRLEGMQGSEYHLGAGKTVSLAADQPTPANMPRLVVNRGHNSGIFIARWSHDGRLVASGGSDNRVLVWRASDMQLLAELRGHVATVDALAFSPDGKTLASGAQDGVVMIWDLMTGKRIRALTARRSWVNGLAYTEDGRLFASYNGISTGSVVEWRSGQTTDGDWTAIEVPKPVDQGVTVDWRQRMGPVGPSNAALYDVDLGQWRVPGSAWADMAGTFGAQGGLLAGHTASKLVGAVGVPAKDGGDIQISFDEGATISRRIGAYQKSRVDRLTFSPSGEFLASSGEYGTLAEVSDREKNQVKIWKTAGGSPKLADGSSVFAFSPDNRMLLGGYGADYGLRLWEAATGKALGETSPGPPGFSALALSSDGAWMALARADGQIHLWNLMTGRLERVLVGHPGTIKRLRFDASGQRLAACGLIDRYLSVWNTSSGALVWAIAPADSSSSSGIDDVSFSADGTTVEYSPSARVSSSIVFARNSSTGELISVRKGWVATGPGGAGLIAEAELPGEETPGSDGTQSERPLKLRFQPVEGRPFDLQLPPVPTTAIISTAYSPRGHFVGVLRQIPFTDSSRDYYYLSVWDTTTGLLQSDFPAAGVYALAISSEGSLVGGADDGRVVLLQRPSQDSSSGKGWNVKELTRSSGSVRDIATSATGLITAVGDDGFVRLWRDESSNEPITVNSSSEAKWLVTRPDGRFDAANPDNLDGFSWVMPDDPFRPLSPTIFMRDFFEPQVLAHAINCESDPILLARQCVDDVPPSRALVDLNRVEPVVRIDSVRPGARPDEAIVTVTALAASDRSQRNNKTETQPHDLRLFRDRQLVGHWTASSSSSAARGDLNAWREMTRISGTREFVVRLPAAKVGKIVQFTAYAFNEDRVKGATASFDFPVLSRIRTPKPKAFVIAIGIDRYDNPGRQLNYAAGDASATVAALSNIKGYDVVAVPLLSDSSTANATKATIRAVFAALAGQPFEPERLSHVPNAGKLQRIRPDDILIITFSGHGYTDAARNFFLLPADAKSGVEMTPEMFSSFISSDDLGAWLEDVDAGQISIIIDACYSASSVAGSAFRAGPMGDPGFGQLSYDKGIRILAATQADDVALELGSLKHGLLTYALVQEGLGQDGCGARVEHDDEGVTLQAWMRYGERRTPSLYNDARAGKVRTCKAVVEKADLVVPKNAFPDPRFPDVGIGAQTPVLFDFSKGAKPVLIGVPYP